MRLICFPHYTSGGLLCDIFADKLSPVLQNGGIGSLTHNMGKIGDSESIFTDFNQDEFDQQVSKYQDTKLTIGTHCWPGNIDLTKFDEVILITTHTTKSKIYRWLRAWHLYFCKGTEVNKLSGMELIDKQRELAKNYLIPFTSVPGAINLEFADIVDTTAEFYKVTAGLSTEQHVSRWKEINEFLYASDLWNDNLVQRYFEAEFEVAHGRFYQYH